MRGFLGGCCRSLGKCLSLRSGNGVVCIFVVLGCSYVIEGGVCAHGKKMKTFFTSYSGHRLQREEENYMNKMMCFLWLLMY